MEYRRLWRQGGTYFFTVNLLQRKNNDLLTRNIELLRSAIAQTRNKYPFIIHGWVVLPDHLHCLIELPPNDDNFALRWRLIKMIFSKSLPASEYISETRIRRSERGIWQRRYWEHLIRNQQDFNAHLDYIHINPMKHSLVSQVIDWPYSTFHKYVQAGTYAKEWAGNNNLDLNYND